MKEKSTEQTKTPSPKLKPDTKRMFVLDTNILMHDPTALFQFKEHDVFIPMVVLEELDKGKKGLSDIARNVRQTNRFLDSLIEKSGQHGIFNGLPLIPPYIEKKNFEGDRGRLFFQKEDLPSNLPSTMPGNILDNSILETTLALQKKHPDLHITLVSKDINLRIKAAVVGIQAEDYFNDKTLDDLSLMYSGMYELPNNFWQNSTLRVDSWQEDGRTFYKIVGNETKVWHPNMCLYEEKKDSDFEAIVRKVVDNEAYVEYVQNYRKPKHRVYGINARNVEQNFALNFLLDPDIDFITLVGPAGTGKTLLTLASALHLTLTEKRYREIIVTRVTVPVGEDIGFLPGTELEKMTPWMGALMDNLEVLNNSNESAPWHPVTDEALIQKHIRISSLNFMRGRTFLNKFIIIDEAQNLTAKQMQTLVTRAGPGTKMVCLGNISQIDTPYLTETTSGLTYVVQQFKDWPHSAHITLTRGERSRLADHATKVL